MCHFMFFAEMSGGRWVTFGMITKLAQSVSVAFLPLGLLVNFAILIPQIGLRKLSYFLLTLAKHIFIHFLVDRDIRKWRVDAEQSQQSEQRRDLFYEVFTFDSWQVRSTLLRRASRLPNRRYDY